MQEYKKLMSLFKINFYRDTNIVSSLNLLSVIENNNLNKIIFSGSATVYGNTNKELQRKGKEILQMY